jgi:hypothetical protein
LSPASASDEHGGTPRDGLDYHSNWSAIFGHAW